MDYFFMFLLAFVSELAVCGYTIAVSRNKILIAALCSASIALVNAGILISIVDNRTLLAPSILGEVSGTIAMLSMARKG